MILCQRAVWYHFHIIFGLAHLLLLTFNLFLTFVLLRTESSEAAKGKPQVKLTVKKNTRIQIKRLKGKGPVHHLSNIKHQFLLCIQSSSLLTSCHHEIHLTLLIHYAGRKKAKNAKPPTKDKVDSMVEWRTGPNRQYCETFVRLLRTSKDCGDWPWPNTGLECSLGTT